MSIIQTAIFMIGIPFCVFGNVIAYVIASRKGLAPSFTWAGTPFYIYSLCRKSPEQAGKVATYLSLSSSVVFCIVMLIFVFANQLIVGS